MSITYQQPMPLRLVSDFVSPMNALVFSFTTIIDLFTPSQPQWSMRITAAALALIVLLFLIHAVSRYQAQSAGGVLEKGIGMLRDKSILMSVLTSAFVGLLLVGKLAHAEGAIAGQFPVAKDFQQQILGMKADVSAIKQDVALVREALVPSDARGQLERLGYHLDDESKARAIESCDLKALQLYIGLKEKLPSQAFIMGVPAWSVLEKPIISNNERLPEMLDMLVAYGMKFDELYQMNFVNSKPELIPGFADFKAKLPADKKFHFYPQNFRANALTMAIWFKNATAANRLLKLGTRTDKGLEIVVDNQTNERIALASASDEARRLGIQLNPQ